MLLKNKTKHILVVVFFIGGILGGFFLLRDSWSENSSFSAQFADNILRPVIGNTATIKLETLFFNTQDKIEHTSYKLGGVHFPNQTKQTSKLDWKPLIIDTTQSDKPIMETATYYPDRNRPYALVHLVMIDISQVFVGAVAGKKEPASEVGKPGPGVIPDEVRMGNSLLAAFNGGFQYRDGQYGMVVNGTVYLSPKEGLATFLVDKEGQIAIKEYQNTLNINNYTVLRQNGEMLVKDGVVMPSSSDKLAKVWGRSLTSNMYTWRSGVGVTIDNKLIYAVGPSLIPQTLGESLRAAGAENAMELDINPFWVRFSLYKSSGNGNYIHQSPFVRMYDGGKQFLFNDIKDFFYVYLKNPQQLTNLSYLNTRKGWNSDK